MAKGEIIVKSETRPCMISDVKFTGKVGIIDEYEEVPHIWHNWFERNGEPYALVERKDGTMRCVHASMIRFIDNAFCEYAWGDKDV